MNKQNILSMIKKARKEKGLNQTEISKLLDITQAHYSRMENGIQEIDISTLSQLCSILGIEIIAVSPTYSEEEVKENIKALDKVVNHLKNMFKI